MLAEWINRWNLGQARNRPRWLCCCNTRGMEDSLEPVWKRNYLIGRGTTLSTLEWQKYNREAFSIGQESRDQQLLSCKDALKPWRQKEMKLLRKKKPLGNHQLGKRIWVLSCWRPTNTKGKAMKGLVSRITWNTGQVIFTLLQSRYLLGKDMQQETDQQDLWKVTWKEMLGTEQQ